VGSFNFIDVILLGKRSLLSSILCKIGKIRFPGTHFDHLQAWNYFIHQPNSLVRSLGRLCSNSRYLWSQPYYNIKRDNRFKYNTIFVFTTLLYLLCNGIKINNVITPSTDDTPTSCHKKYIVTIVCNGPIHKNGIYKYDISNRCTSFDMRFTIWPVRDWSRQFVLSLSA